jgi:hypothetical protein
MKDYRETGLPMNEPEVFKAFSAWRLNAKDYAELSGMSENYPLEVAQLINAANPQYTELMKLALLTTVPEPAWGVIEKRFGPETIDQLEEMWKHARTGYSYCDQASDAVRGLTMAAAIQAFDDFIKSAAGLENTLSLAELGGEPEEILRKLDMPECKMFDRLEGKLTGTPYADLENLYAEKLYEYREARQMQNLQLAEMGLPFGDDEDEAARKTPFEAQNLVDAPEVRKAYDILTQDTRVGPQQLANALSVGRLLSELPDMRDAAVIAAGMIDAGLPRRTRSDAEFLGNILPQETMHVLNDYDVRTACLKSAAPLSEAPPAVRQLAVARGLVLLDAARKQCEQAMEYIDLRSEMLPPGVGDALKAENLTPVQAIAAVIPKALAPILNKTGSRQLEQLFDAQVKDLRRFVATHMPAMPGAEANGGRINFRMKPPGGDFGM